MHGISLSQRYAGFFSSKKVEDYPLFTVLRAGRIARSRTNSPVLFVKQSVEWQIFSGGVSPELLSDLCMQQFSESFGQAVGKHLNHNGIIVVVLIFEMLHPFFNLQACCHGKQPQVISLSCCGRCHKISQ